MREAYNDDFIAKFKSGEYDMQYLDRAVKQALTAKFRQGLFEHPFAYTGQELEKKFYGNTEEDKKISLQSARESMVLLKNDGTLPGQESYKEDRAGWSAGKKCPLFLWRIYPSFHG